MSYRINDPQKYKFLYRRELYDVIIDFQCVQNLPSLGIINSRKSVLSNYHNHYKPTQAEHKHKKERKVFILLCLC